MDILETIRTRRSTRQFKDMPVPQEKLEKIIEAGRYAASGCNVQNAHFIVVKKREVLDELRELVKQEFAKMNVEEAINGSVSHSIDASKKGVYVFHYDPEILIIVANSINNPNAIADTACAINNMMLMANELNLGSCWINQLRWLNENTVLRHYLESLGMREDERVFGSMALGIPATETEEPVRVPLPRSGNEVTIIE